MRLSHLFILTAVSTTSAYATGLSTPLQAPVLDSSTYRNAMYQPVTSNVMLQPVNSMTAMTADSTTLPATMANQVNNRLNEIQVELVRLRNKVDAQLKEVTNLKNSQNVVNANVEKRLASLTVATADMSKKVGTPFKSIGTTNLDAVKVMSGGQTTTPSVPVTGEQARYQNAYALLRSNQVDRAMIEFERIIIDFPSGKYADNAQYWLGEALIKKGDKQSAMVAFDKVVQMYPSSDKVPDALLKIGITQLSLGERTLAKQYLDYVTITYPNAPAASIAIQRKVQAGL